MPAKKKRAISVATSRAPSPVDEEIGRRLRLLRVDRGLSQTELGAVLEVSFQQIQKYEKGKNRVSAGRLVEIATKLATSPHELLGWMDKRAITPLMDEDTYKLMRSFSQLPDRYKNLMRSHISHLIALDE